MTTSGYHRKLIEVALPLDEINSACKADKDRKTGTIRNLHKWFAPMPLPAWRALLFAAAIDDPEDDEKRAYLLDVIKRLVANGADVPDADTVAEARKIIAAQFPGGLPTVIDPFCGGGSTLVEAQRLGFSTFGSDLNPVPVLITRTLTELLPKVYGRQPLHPEGDVTAVATSRGRARQSSLLPSTSLIPKPSVAHQGLARDVAYYAEVVRQRVWEALGPHYSHDQGEQPVAWLWARTAVCPNPACGITTVLTTSWWLSKKKDDLAWVDPRVADGRVLLDVISGRTSGEAPPSPKSPRGATFVCLGCKNPIDDDDLVAQVASGGLGVRMTAVVAEKQGRRVYRAPHGSDIQAALAGPATVDIPDTVPVGDGGSRNRFGLVAQADLYTPRQLALLISFSGAVRDVYDQVIRDGGSTEWATAVVTMLGLAVGKLAHGGSTQTRWKFDSRTGTAKPEAAFGRNDLPMTWDFAEAYPFGSSAWSWNQCVSTMLAALPYVGEGEGRAVRADARTVSATARGLVATDPPYFDAIGYADLSDYFYVWHRLVLRNVHPDLYATIAAPKSGELTALASHHGNSRERARAYFIEGFTETFRNLQTAMDPSLPMLVVYASREQNGAGDEQTRWCSILTAMIQADLEIVGTWPINGTGSSRMIGQGANAVATYVAMVCRPRPVTAGACSLGDFNRSLRRELRPAVHDLQAAGILPVDLAQAAIGPGMQVYSRYREVLDQSGRRVSVDQALRLINAALGEVLDEQEGELDPYSRFAVAWWEKHSWEPAAFGEADQLARPQGISVDDVVRAHVARYSKPGFVALLGAADLDRSWTPSLDARPTAWEAVHHLADRLIDGGGAVEAGRLMAKLGLFRDPAQSLVYRLHDIAARKGRTKDQERYNALIGSWSDLLAVGASQKDGLF